MSTANNSHVEHAAGHNPALAQLLGVPEESAEHLYVDNAALLRRIAMRSFHVPEEDANTLVHDVFLTFIASNREVRTNARAYLIGAIKHASQKYWRSRHSDKRIFSNCDESTPSAADLTDFSQGVLINQIVAALLKRLGTRCKEALRRYYLEEEDTAAIAQALKTTPANVNYIMHHCRKRAKEIYESLTRNP